MTGLIQNIIEQSGYFGIFALMILENVFPPIPSEIIVPFAGYVAARGDLSAIGVVISATLGSVCGTFIWYLLARWFGEERLRRLVARHGRWITMNQRDITRASKWFERFGAWAVFLGRLVPTVRTLISIPAGLVCMSPLKFFLCTLAGSLLWVCVLTWLGLQLDEHYDRVEAWLSPVTTAVIAVIVITYIWRVIRYKPDE
ncbi:MAG: DedA family protein [Gammaproteobacteria bacterium]|nr:DedA family protein [Gammaproteobacteria bacterium]